MRKKTAPRTQKHRKTSSSKKLGLIVKEKNADQSAKKKSALDNHFHRTDLPISCCATSCHELKCGTASIALGLIIQ